MQTINGKLLGQTTSEFDELTQQINDLDRDADEAKAYIQQLEQRCENLENSFNTELQRQNLTYRQEIATTRSSLNHLGTRLTSLEKIELDRLKNSLRRLERQMPNKFLWLTFSSSLAIGSLCLWSWFDFYPLQHKLQHQKVAALSELAIVTADYNSPLQISGSRDRKS
jgi:hypothetical protein